MFSGIHDSNVVAYAVDSRVKELVLTIAPGTGSAVRDFRIVFRGVVAHQFVYPELPSIVSDLEEVASGEILKREWMNLSEGSRQCGWPGPWATSLNAALMYCISKGIKGYELSQAYGMSGWVLAASVEKVDAP